MPHTETFHSPESLQSFRDEVASYYQELVRNRRPAETLRAVGEQIVDQFKIDMPNWFLPLVDGIQNLSGSKEEQEIDLSARIEQIWSQAREYLHGLGQNATFLNIQITIRLYYLTASILPETAEILFRNYLENNEEQIIELLTRGYDMINISEFPSDRMRAIIQNQPPLNFTPAQRTALEVLHRVYLVHLQDQFPHLDLNQFLPLLNQVPRAQINSDTLFNLLNNVSRDQFMIFLSTIINNYSLLEIDHLTSPIQPEIEPLREWLS
jgi:hypothetical protein